MLEHALGRCRLICFFQEFNCQGFLRVFSRVGPPDLDAGLHQYLIPRLALRIRGESALGADAEDEGRFSERDVPFNRDSPDESPIGVNICAFAVLLQDRSAVRTDAITSASWTAVEELIWPFPLAFGHARPVGCNLNAWATERLMLALVAAAAAVPR